MSFNQSFCLPMFQRSETTIDELFKTAAQAGYSGFEIWFRDKNFTEIVAKASEHRLQLASMCGHKSSESGLNNPENHDRIEAELRESLEIASELKVPGVICFSGNRNPNQTEEEAIAACVAGFKRVAPYAEKAGVNLNMELLNSKRNHKGYQCDHTSWGVEVCRAVGSQRVKLLYDIFHMQVMEGDVIQTIQDHIDFIAHFHTAGNPGRKDLDQDQEVNYPAICRAIRETGFNGYVGHEFSPKGDPLRALESAFTCCSG